MKKQLSLLLTCLLLISCDALPYPKVGSGLRGEEFGIDANINESTIDNYLGREDVAYRDMRMLYDQANYEAIGGDSYLSGIVEGFEVVPLPYIIPIEGLPSEVGNTYSGDTLFSKNEDGTYSPNYKESYDVIHLLFPMDKAIFLMCGGGGYASMTKSFLISIGYNKNKIYNVGGYWFYDGDHKVITKQVDSVGNVTYDYSKIVYHDISDFTKYTKL